MISTLQLGKIDYASGLRLQEKLVALRKTGRVGDVLLLLEHAPVITLGRNAKAKNILASPELLAQRGVEICECDRGGDVTFHGPGQLVAYPIFDLRGFSSTSAFAKSLGAIEYVRRLEEVLIRTCADLGILTKRIAGLTGVWTDPMANRSSASFGNRRGAGAFNLAESKAPQNGLCEAKIAALGVHISRGVTSHGIALNVNTDLSFFDLIVPCGIISKPVTSMSKEVKHDLPMQEVAHSLSRNFGKEFNRQILWRDNLDTLLGGNLGIPIEKPENLRRIRGEDDSAWA